MAALVYIRDAKEKNLLLLGISEEGDSARYTVTRSLYTEIGEPPRGALLDRASLYAIKLSDEEYRAKKKALSLLSYADSSERILRDKLRRAGFSRDTAERVSEEMVSLGYVNEDRQLERLIEAEANIKLRGPMKIIPHLTSKGYPQDKIRSVMKRLVSCGTVDFKKNAKILVEKKLPSAEPDEKKKLLYRNGYKIC